MSTDEDPVAWLRAQVEARKAAACASDGQAGAWLLREHPSDHVMVRNEAGLPVVYDEGTPSDTEAAHITLNDPQDTIARCEAELAILDEHAPEWADYVDGDGIERTSLECKTCVPPGTPDNSPCRTVRLLAGGYRHWPGYAEHFASTTDSRS